MPLTPGKSKAAFVANIKTELAANKPRAQALAIAYSEKRRAKDRRLLDGRNKIAAAKEY